MMKKDTRNGQLLFRGLTITFGLCVTMLMASCLYTEPVFTEGFAEVDESIAGVWVAEADAGDPRTNQFVVCAPIDNNRYLLHHPARDANSFYYEARPILGREGTLLQLRILATFSGGVPKPDSEVFTLVWLQPRSEDRLLVRALAPGSLLDPKNPREVASYLEDPERDWNDLFGEGIEYRKVLKSK